MSHIFRIGILFSLLVMVVMSAARVDAITADIVDIYDPSNISMSTTSSHEWTHSILDDGYDPLLHEVTAAGLVVTLHDDGDEDYTHSHWHRTITREEYVCTNWFGIQHCEWEISYLEGPRDDPPHYEYALMSGRDGLLTSGPFEVDDGDIGWDFWWLGALQDGVISAKIYGTGHPDFGSSGNDWIFDKATLYVNFELQGVNDSPGDGSETNGDEPIPEPTTIALLGIGLVGLAGAEARRRRKKKAVDNS